MVRVGIVNVTGYAGAELARLLSRHPAVRLVSVTGRSHAGQPLGAVFPHLDDLRLTVEAEIGDVDLCFTALPHHASAEVVPALLERGMRVVDISADFRLRDVAVYERWYGAHPAPDLLPLAVYGLPERYASEVASARLVANPGCYPTTTILGLLPLIDVVEPDIIVDAKSGISGAGRTMKLNVNHFCEVAESCQAYGLDGHRHHPEILQELSAARRAAGNEDVLCLTFVPHLVPMVRGILATSYARLREPLSQEQLYERYEAYYADKPFVRVVRQSPQTKHTLGSNLCLVHPRVDESTGRVVVVSCLDNLVKGAAGQAVQNMNLMLGLPETTGLEAAPLYP